MRCSCDSGRTTLFFQADTASLRLLKLLHQQEHCHLLIIAAYRENECDERHPLVKLIAELKSPLGSQYGQQFSVQELSDSGEAEPALPASDKSPLGGPVSSSSSSSLLQRHSLHKSLDLPEHQAHGAAAAASPGQSNVDEVKLRPLDLNCVTQLVVDSFRCKRDTAVPLATLLLKKTAGVSRRAWQCAANVGCSGGMSLSLPCAHRRALLLLSCLFFFALFRILSS